MFLATALLYPCALALLCVGAGLLTDRLCGGGVPAPLLVAVGAAALVGVTQLAAFITPIARASPYLCAGLGAGGLWCGRRRLGALLARRATLAPLLIAPVIAYAIALAPVLAAGRASFSSFQALADSAVHLIGADYLLRHGMSYGHLDLSNSYGRFINAYYNTSYPSGADTLFGASAKLLGLPLIWAFQPFIAFMLASACGPAWMLARRFGLARGAAAVAAVAVAVPALVYGYELIGSIKEIAAVSMLLTAAALVVADRNFARRGPRGAVPLALALAAGISCLGIAFGAWALTILPVAAAVLLLEVRAGALAPQAAGGVVAVGIAAGVVAALPTWADLRGSLQTATSIASTSNAGNLHSALKAVQVLGVWLGGSYKIQPTGSGLVLTHVAIGPALAGALLGVVGALRRRAFGLLAWLALMLLAWLLVTVSVTTWASAKTLVLTSPAVAVLIWGGIAALGRAPRFGRAVAALAGAALLASVLASDALQYRASNLAPTARYEELSSVGDRFAGRGPALFTDFDEYAMYELRNLDIGGPDFVYPPPALAAIARGYGDPVELDRAPPAALVSYPLIVTRRDPLASRPPAAYGLAWQGDFYEVWSRLSGAPPAHAHVSLRGRAATQCAAILALAHGAPAHEMLFAAVVAAAAIADLNGSPHPARWGHERAGLVLSSAGTLRATLAVPAAGAYELWLAGQFMPAVHVAVDGRRQATISGQLSGNSLVPGPVPPIRLQLSAGTHTIAVTRSSPGLGPGERGAAVLDALFLTPADEPPGGVLRSVGVREARRLCGARYRWVELVGG